MRLLAVLGLAASLTAPVAYAAEWVVTAHNDDLIDEIDVSSIRRDGPYIKVWTRANYRIERVASDGQKFKSQLTQYYYHCPKRQAALVQLTSFSEFNGSGRVIRSASVPFKSSDLEDIIPGSIMEGTHDDASKRAKGIK